MYSYISRALNAFPLRNSQKLLICIEAFDIFCPLRREKTGNPQRIFCDSMLHSCLHIYQTGKGRNTESQRHSILQSDNEPGDIAINLDLPLIQR